MNKTEHEKLMKEQEEKIRKEFEGKIAELEKKYKNQPEPNTDGEENKPAEEKTPQQEYLNNISTTKKNRAVLYGKMAKVMKEVKRVPQNGWNKFHKYKYANETDLLEGVRDFLHEYGLAFFPTVIDSNSELRPIHDKYEPNNPDKTKLKWFTNITMQFTLACADTGELLETVFEGQAEDDSDKGFYKAYTNTLKYYLRQTFLIPTGETDGSSVDGQPMDVEYDNNKPQNQSNNNNSGQRNQNQNKGTNNAKNNNKGTSKPEADTADIPKPQLLGKWKLIGGTEENFKPFYDKQIKDGKTNAIINKWLDQKLVEKSKQQQADEEKKKKEEKETKNNDKKEEEKIDGEKDKTDKKEK